MNNNLEFENEDPSPDSIEDNHPRTNYGEGYGGKETLEEAVERLFPFTKDDSENRIITIKRLFWIEGVKWQAGRMHSEEELKSAFKIGFNIGYGSPVQELDLKNEHCERWFEQFKKK